MLALGPARPSPLRVLCLGAHPDDIEIGAAGTVLQLVATGRLASVTWVVLSGSPERRREGEAAADALLAGVPERDIRSHGFRDGYFPSDRARIKDAFEELKAVDPDVVFAPRLDDAHQDHRLVAELAWNTFRHHLVLGYEIPKYDGDLAPPNLFVPLPDVVLERKIEILVRSFPSQAGRSWFDPELFRGLARLRGVEAGAGGRYAEAFHARKVVLAMDGSPGSSTGVE